MACHALTFENLLWVHATDRTDLTRVSLATVRLAVTFEVMTLDGSSPAFTLDDTCIIYEVGLVVLDFLYCL